MSVRDLPAAVLVAAAVCGGCSTVKLPLCPAIARNSYQAGEPAMQVNKFAALHAERQGLVIAQLSWFSAEFSGSPAGIDWFATHYPAMLCAFDPARETTRIRETYMSCMAHAKDWIQKVQSAAPEQLMLAETMFYENCAR